MAPQDYSQKVGRKWFEKKTEIKEEGVCCLPILDLKDFTERNPFPTRYLKQYYIIFIEIF